LDNDVVCELNHFATYRLQVLGGRKVICARTMDVVAYLQNVEKVQTPVFKNIYGFLKTCTAEQGKTFLQNAPIYQATIHSGEIFYLPAGWVFREQPDGKASDGCVGCRVQSLSQADIKSIEPLDNYLTDKVQKTNENLRSAKEKFTCRCEPRFFH
jgi:hypothetical protein